MNFTIQEILFIYCKMIVIYSLQLKFGKTNLHCYFAFTGCCGRPTVSTARRPRSNSYSALDSTSDDGGTLEECKTLSNKKPVIYIFNTC